MKSPEAVTSLPPRLPDAFLARPIAHRGLHDDAAPENSMAAIIAASDAGYAIEIDLQVSSDGVAMVFHDDRLDRLTAHTGPVRGRHAADLSNLTLGRTAETIPRLRDVLDRVAGRAALLIELKDQSGALGPVDGRLEADTADALSGYSGDVAVMSFNPHSIGLMSHLAPDIPRGLVTCAFDPVDWPGVPETRLLELCRIPDYSKNGCSFISHHWKDLDAAAVAQIKHSGGKVLCWTLRDRLSEMTARHRADGITFEGYAPG